MELISPFAAVTILVLLGLPLSEKKSLEQHENIFDKHYT